LCTFGYRYEVTLAQELLVLLIRLVSERGFCGLTEVEALRRELVQRLAVGDATHSALLKALPPRLQDSKHVQECLDSVATYRNPSGMQQVWLFVTIYFVLVQDFISCASV
jgi:E3 ubiquitin-protein ligase UBR3